MCSFLLEVYFFHPDGLCLYSGAVDMMKVYSWEPAACHDSVALGWSKVADMAVAQDQLVNVFTVIYGKKFTNVNVLTNLTFIWIYALW